MKHYRIADYPAVQEFIHELGITVEAGATHIHPGRNPSWRGSSPDGAAVFVKFENAMAGVGRKTDGTRMFHGLRASNDAIRKAVSTIEPSAISADGRVQIYPWHKPISCAERLVSEELDPGVLEEVARDIARLHRLGEDLRDTTSMGEAEPMPGLYGIPSLPIEAVPGLSGGQLAVWRLLHGDDELLDRACRTVLSSSPGADRTFIHGDLRLDQVLLTESSAGQRVSIIDWESFGYGDPARDSGTFIGNIVNIVVTKALLDVKRAVRKADWQYEIPAALSLARPLLIAFLAAYTAESGMSASDTKAHVLQAVRFGGWHQFDRLLATTEDAPTAAPLAMALAGIGRTFVLHPDEVDKELELSDVI